MAAPGRGRAQLLTSLDPPWRDPGRRHGVAMEGYFWRVTQAATGDAAIVYCAVCPGWGLVGLAAEPGGFERWAVTGDVWADGYRLGVRLGALLQADPGSLRVRLADDARLDLRLGGAGLRRPLHTMGLAHLLPLPQHWHVCRLGVPAAGELVAGERRVAFREARGYAEKNWGSRFPARWWWGEAHDFAAGDVSVAFAGGPLAGVPASAALVALDGRLLRGLPPGLVELAPGAWRLRARAGSHTVQIDGEADPARALTLQVPLPGERRTAPASRHHLAGTLRLLVRRRGRTVFAGESPLAGLETEA